MSLRSRQRDTLGRFMTERPIDDEDLALGRWGIQFRGAAIERAYKRWRFDQSLNTRRAYALVSLAFWGSVGVLQFVLDLAVPAFVELAIMTPILCALYVVNRARHRFAASLQLISCGVSGMIGVIIGLG